MIHTCETCGYSTNRISNFKDHMNKKKPCVRKENVEQSKKIAKIDTNGHNNGKGITHNYDYMNKSDTENSQNCDNKEFKCSKCNKVLSSKRSLNRHFNICNGLNNGLQCEICLKIFSNYSAKSRHKKNVQCKPPSLSNSVKNNMNDILDENKRLQEEVNLLKNGVKKGQNINKSIGDELRKLKEILNGKKELVAIKKIKMQIKALDEYIETSSESMLLKKTCYSGKKFTPSQKRDIACNQDWQCNLCSIKLPANYEIDHIKSIANGGDNNIENGQALCKPCHESKTIEENIARLTLDKIFNNNTT